MNVVDWMFAWLLFSCGVSLMVLAISALVAAVGYGWGTPDDDELDDETLSLEEALRIEKGEEDE